MISFTTNRLKGLPLITETDRLIDHVFAKNSNFSWHGLTNGSGAELEIASYLFLSGFAEGNPDWQEKLDSMSAENRCGAIHYIFQELKDHPYERASIEGLLGELVRPYFSSHD